MTYTMHCNKDGFYNSVREWIDAGMPLNSFIRGDCMEGMAAMPDKFVNLAIVDPPYGNDEPARGKKRDYAVKQKNGSILMATPKYDFRYKDWDRKRPTRKYFDSIIKISENQIIFGGNYFSDVLKPSMGWIIWNKVTSGDFSDCELIYTSFMQANRLITYLWNGMLQGKGIVNGNVQIGNKELNEERIHPTQKPAIIYRWLLQNYAQPGDIIVDTHVGSASSLIACEQMGFQYVGFEIDSDYFDDSCNRIIQARKLLQQNEIFQREEVYNGKQHEQHELF